MTQQPEETFQNIAGTWFLFPEICFQKAAKHTVYKTLFYDYNEINLDPIRTYEVWMSKFRRGTLALGLWGFINCMIVAVSWLCTDCKLHTPPSYTVGGSLAFILVLPLQQSWLGEYQPLS